jgi:hypothetical protein
MALTHDFCQVQSLSLSDSIIMAEKAFVLDEVFFLVDVAVLLECLLAPGTTQLVIVFFPEVVLAPVFTTFLVVAEALLFACSRLASTRC